MAIQATVTLIDSFNTLTTKTYECEATTLAQAATDIGALITTLEAISDLGVVSVSYVEKDISEASAAAALSSVDTGATFRMRLNNGKVAAHKVPGFDLAKVSSDRNIDIADADVAAYFANFESAGDFTVNEGNTMSQLLSGKLDV
jgi:hypothetical protein